VFLPVEGPDAVFVVLRHGLFQMRLHPIDGRFRHLIGMF
jgi:hypothetical protein